jgi:nucleotide-binding universal stress UspA family protein
MAERRILVLVDGIDSRELLGAVDEALRPGDAEVVLVYVVGHGPRAGLDMVRRRPGGLTMPPHLERSVSAAERQRGDEALDEAARLARPLAAIVRTVIVEGEPGHAVVELAARERATAVALRRGPHGLGPIGRFIADHSACTLVVVR